MIASVGRQLTAEDILRFKTLPRVDESGPPLLQRITINHRRAARLIAAGKSVSEVANAVGRTPQHISNLCSDPTFANAVAEYEKMIEDADIDEGIRIRGTLLEIAELSLDSIRDQLESDPKAVSISERRQLATMALDRTVAPPRTPQAPAPSATQITFNIASPRGSGPRFAGTQDASEPEPIDITPAVLEKP
jgi:hypothetical protein